MDRQTAHIFLAVEARKRNDKIARLRAYNKGLELGVYECGRPLDVEAAMAAYDDARAARVAALKKAAK